MHEKICPICLCYMLDDALIGWMRCSSCGYMTKKESSMITIQELLMGRAKFEELPEELQRNAEELLRRLNMFRKEFGRPMYVSSGYRSPEINKSAGGGPKSAHLTLEACDFRDNGELFEFIKKDPSILDRLDLYMEDPQWSPTWIHLQSRPASKRIFIPSNTPPKDPSRKI